MEFGSLEEFLLWIAQGGGAMVLSGFVVAYVLENLAFWHNLPILVKKWVPVVLTGLFAFAATVLLDLGAFTAVPPLVATLILTMIGWLFSQIAYNGIKEGEYADATRADA